MAQHDEFDHKKRVVEWYYRFPHHFSNYDAKKYSYIVDDLEAEKRYKEWTEKLMMNFDDPDYYYRLIDEEYAKIKKELDL